MLYPFKSVLRKNIKLKKNIIMKKNFITVL